VTAGGAKKMGTLLRYGTEQWFHVVRRYGPAVSWSNEAATMEENGDRRFCYLFWNFKITI